MKCWEEYCSGLLSEQEITHTATLKDGREVIVPNLLVIKCSKCTEYWLDGPACRRIEDEIQKVDPNYFGKTRK